MNNPAPQEPADTLARRIEQAVALHRAGRLNEAEAIYAQILKSAPAHVDTLMLMANLQMTRGNLAEAQRLATAAAAARPESADALVMLGHIQRASRRDDDALASFEKALAREPNHIDALGMRGDTLLARGRAEEALENFNRILAVEPRHADARANRAAAYAALGRHDEALADCDAALIATPGNGIALFNRANALASLGRQEEALAAFNHLVTLIPQYAAAWNNRGNTLTALKRHAEAVESFARAIALQPNFADAHFNQSLALLATGDYAQGWNEYEWRWRRTGAAVPRNFGRPLWQSRFPVAGKTVLLHVEQGLGDVIQFARYVSMLANLGASVVLEVHPELKSLMSRLAGTSQVIALGEPWPAFDYHYPIGSLPLAFRTALSNVPAEIPYLSADESRVAKWRPQLDALKHPRVAVVWAGNPNHFNDRNRSIAFARLKPLWDIASASFISLQRMPPAADAAAIKTVPGLLHLGDAVADLDDTAAILAQCDLLISVDTSVVHLAAAMGRPTWILVPFSPDWRWTLQGVSSPWYPAARLYRQPKAGDWESVIARVCVDLTALPGTP